MLWDMDIFTFVEDVKGGGGVVGPQDVVATIPDVCRKPQHVEDKKDDIHS